MVFKDFFSPGRAGSGWDFADFLLMINKQHATRVTTATTTTSSAGRRKRALKNRRPEEHA